MREVDINTLVSKNNYLIENIPDNIIIIGKIDFLNIKYKYNKIDLYKVICNRLYYYNQEGESIKNHILPNSLEELYCANNELTSLPILPNSLRELYCNNNQLTSFTDVQLPSSIKYLYCYNNKLTSFTDVKLPNSLEYFQCDKNELENLPDFSHINHEISISFNQDLPISYIPYNGKLRFCVLHTNKMNIEGYPYNPITNQEELDKYMEYIKNYKLNRVKSARK